MERNSPAQLELFSQGLQHPHSGRRLRLPANFMRLYERALLVAIAFVITSIASFSLGVLRGKTIAMTRTNSRLDTAAVTRAPAASVPSASAPQARSPGANAPKQAEPLRYQPVAKKPDGFSIQLASYQAKRFAQKEAELLKKRGFSPSLSLKGSYVVLYVSFDDKQAAKAALSKLKTRYRDCFIRRL